MKFDPLKHLKLLSLVTFCLSLNAQPASSIDLNPLDAKRVSRFVKVPAKFLTVSKPLNNDYIIVLFHDESKYPPAEPGALLSEPLEAAGRGR